MRTPADVADELTHPSRPRSRPDHIWFADDIFGLRSDWLAEFAERVQALDAASRSRCSPACDLMTPGRRRAGAVRLRRGVAGRRERQPASPRRDGQGDHRRGDPRRSRCAGAKRHPRLLLHPVRVSGRDVGRHRVTIAMVRELLPDDIGVSVSYPLPGTRFHEMVKFDLERPGELAGLGRPGDDVRRHVHDAALPLAAPQPARRSRSAPPRGRPRPCQASPDSRGHPR